MMHFSRTHPPFRACSAMRGYSGVTRRIAIGALTSPPTGSGPAMSDEGGPSGRTPIFDPHGTPMSSTGPSCGAVSAAAGVAAGCTVSGIVVGAASGRGNAGVFDAAGALLRAAGCGVPRAGGREIVGRRIGSCTSFGAWLGKLVDATLAAITAAIAAVWMAMESDSQAKRRSRVRLRASTSEFSNMVSLLRIGCTRKVRETLGCNEMVANRSLLAARRSLNLWHDCADDQAHSRSPTRSAG